jgi:thioredoxin reductase (NADPH)
LITNQTEIAIIGAGAAGLYATYCCGISGLNCTIIESLHIPGGQCATLYPEKKVYGIPGFSNILAKDFTDKLTKQCLEFDCEKLFGYQVENISKTSAGLFAIKFNNHNVCKYAKHIILATGIGNMKPSVPNTIIGIDEIDKHSDFVQHYCIKIDIYKGKNVVIAGGGDSAIDFAVNITPIAKTVTLIHRRAKFSCEESKLKDIQKLEESGKLKLMMEHNVSELKEGNEKRIVIIKDQSSNEVFLEVDHIIFCYGFTASCNTMFGLENLGLEIENYLIKVDINTMETSIKNCYAAGDVVTYANKKKNILPCFFEADRAVRIIKESLT